MYDCIEGKPHKLVRAGVMVLTCCSQCIGTHLRMQRLSMEIIDVSGENTLISPTVEDFTTFR